MPDSKISALPSATVPLAGTEVLPIVQSSVTDKVTAADLLRQNGQTVTTSNPVLSLAQTWNAGGVTFTGLKLNVTDTASAAPSLLLDLQVGGVSVFAVGKTGGFSTIASSMGIYNNSAAIYMGGSGDVVLTRDAANTLALRNGTNAQASRVYKTYTDASNYERIEIGGSLSGLGTATYGVVGRAAGTGDATIPMYVGTMNSGLLGLVTGGNSRWTVNTNGHFTAAGDNVYDIGASGATRPRNLYVGTDINMGGTFNRVSGSYSTILDNSGIRITSLGGTTGALRMLQTGIADNYINNEASTGNMVFVSDNAISEFKSGTEAQTVRVYNTFTDSSNYERLAVEWTGNTAYIRTQNTGTGASRSIILSASTAFYFGGGATYQWLVSSSGHLLANTDNTYDIGAAGATRPRNLYVAGIVELGSYLRFGTGGAQMLSPSTTNLTLYNNTASGFGLLQFGGTTSSFPALKRSSTTLEAKLADDSAYAPFSCAVLTSTASINAATTSSARVNNAILAGGQQMFGGTTTTTFGIYFGSGAPTVSAAKGSLYLRSDGSGTGDRMYVNTDGSTTWTAVTTAA